MVIPVIILSILLQVAGSLFALRLISLTGKAWAWILISMALFLMALRRILSLPDILAGRTTPGTLWVELVALTISMLMLAGVIMIRKIFEDWRLMGRRQQRFEQALARSSDLVTVFAPDFSLHYMNEAGRRMLEIPLERDLAGIDITRYRDEEAIRVLKEEAIPGATRNGIWQGETQLTTLNGQGIHVSQVLLAHRDRSGKIDQFTAIMRDISAQKRMESQLVSLNAAKDRLFSTISHDLRGPLGTAAQLTRFSEAELENLSKEEMIRLIGEVHDILKKDYTLVNDLLGWCKAQLQNSSLRVERMALGKVVDGVITILAPRSGSKGVSIRNLVDPALQVSADLHVLQFVLRNLIENAVKFSFRNGLVEVSAQPQDGQVMVIVSDRGVGIPPALHTKIFELDAVYTTEGTEGETGTGLGLPLCAEYIGKHGDARTPCRLWVESFPGAGTRMCFTLPA